jgi:hypothetical protein
MRAQFAVALASLGLVVFGTPSLAWQSLNREVQRTLYPDSLRTTMILTQPAVVENTAVVATTTAVTTEPLVLREIPAVLAPTSAGVAIISEIPSDLDIRREDLGRKIDTAFGLGGLSAAEATDLRTALGQVGAAEVAFRSDGLLTPRESRRLYKAMDKIGSDLDWYITPGSGTFLGARLMPIL